MTRRHVLQNHRESLNCHSLYKNMNLIKVTNNIKRDSSSGSHSRITHDKIVPAHETYADIMKKIAVSNFSLPWQAACGACKTPMGFFSSFLLSFMGLYEAAGRG